MQNPRTLALAALLASGAALAQAELPAVDTLLAQLETSLGDSFGFAAGELGRERVVKGAPYCADAVHETVQWLPDPGGGAPNRIVQRQSSRLCRDGEGRTRQEVERQGHKLVYLRDPVAQEAWVLNPATRSASRLRGHGSVEAAFDESTWRAYGERMREWARQWKAGGGTAVPPIPPMPPVPPVPPVPAMVGKRENEVFVMRADAPLPAPPAPPAVMWRSQTFGPRGAGAVSPLGSKDIEGQPANGERTSWTIEAGKVGNEKPIVIFREVWNSPDLMLTLSSRDFDPRSGEVNYRLQNLRRGEPDTALMKVPADYKTQRPGAKASGATG